MTYCATLTLTPEDEAVFSRTAATQGAHETLTCPTGAALMGWAASRSYGWFRERGLARKIFHSGEVRFSNAVPFAGEIPMFPNPAILLEPKNGDGIAVLGRAAFHAAYGENQPREIATRPVTLHGSAAGKPTLIHRLRNSRPVDALFGYQSLSPDETQFRATIECDEIDEDAWEKLLEQFEGALALGRARANGYGGGYACEVDRNTPSFWPQSPATDAARISFWLLSDALVLDNFGNPKYPLTPCDFGLAPDGWVLEDSESSVRMRRFAPWNRAIDSRDSELAVIEAGSVFTFSRTVENSEHETPLSHIGAGHERGYGRVATIPNDFAFNPAPAEGIQSALSREPLSDLAIWATAAAEMSDTRAVESLVAEFSRSIGDALYRLGDAAPARSQWSRLAEMEMKERRQEAMKQDEWKALIKFDNRRMSLADAMDIWLDRAKNLPHHRRIAVDQMIAVASRGRR